MNSASYSTRKKRFIKVLLSASSISLFYCNTLEFIFTDLSNRYLSTTSKTTYNNNCLWEPPQQTIPNNINWYRTIVAGYPSGDKRLTFMQLEALTGWAARDSWAFETFGMSNHPFIKTNFPHHDGTWGWDAAGDQVILVVRNLREALVEFHNIMWDLGFKDTYEEVLKYQDNLYAGRPPVDLFLSWRDQQVLDEIHWSTFFTDYWMEEGLIRDVLTHNITTLQHWKMLLNPGNLSPTERSYKTVIGNKVVTPSYDPNCVNKMSGGCHPVAVISANRLIRNSTGPAEARKIAQTIQGKPGISDFLAPENEWECLWAELIVHKKGVKTSLVRGGRERKYNFSEEMLGEMINEYNRLITKYSSAEWNWRQTSQDLVQYYKEHLVTIEQELVEVQTGVRVLTQYDFLGPATRKMMNKKARVDDLDSDSFTQSRDLSKDKYDYIDYFLELDTKMSELRKSSRINGSSVEPIQSRDLSMDKNDYSDYFLQLDKKLSELRRSRRINEISKEII